MLQYNIIITNNWNCYDFVVFDTLPTGFMVKLNIQRDLTDHYKIPHYFTIPPPYPLGKGSVTLKRQK